MGRILLGISLIKVGLWIRKLGERVLPLGRSLDHLSPSWGTLLRLAKDRKETFDAFAAEISERETRQRTWRLQQEQFDAYVDEIAAKWNETGDPEAAAKLIRIHEIGAWGQKG